MADNKDMELEEIIVLEDEEGNEVEFELGDKVVYEGKEYVVLLPLAEDDSGIVILEPVNSMKVYVPDNYMGDVIGDLNKRRGRVMGMTPTNDGDQVIEAEVPMAEMTSYAIDLRAMTQSRGSYTFHFVRYEDCPPAAQAKAIEAAKAMAEE